MPRKTAKKYSDTIYAYDIETSKVKVNLDGEDTNLQATYLHGLAYCKYAPTHTAFESFSKGISYAYYRTYSEISDAFADINSFAISGDYYVKVFVHNLSYEFESMMRNNQFCIDNFDKNGFIAVGTHEPLMVRCGHLEFYDSFKIIACKSLETIGNEYNVPKLKALKGGYDQKYYWWSELPKSEITYNKRDCEITLYGICRYMSNFTNVDDVSEIKVSNTAMIKREVKKNKSISSSDEIHWAKYDAQNEFNNNKKFISLMQKALAGGYTHANPYIVGKHIKDVMCYDATSMHPSAMWARKFPYKWKEVNNSYFNSFNSGNIRYLSGANSLLDEKTIGKICYNESIAFERPIRNYFIASVKYTNLKVRKFTNAMYCYISSSKCEELVKCAFDNGKIISAESLIFTGCDIDFLLIELLYTYDKCECTEIITSTKVRFLCNPARNAIKFFAKQKSGYKKLEKLVHDGKATLDDFNFEGIELYNEAVARRILEANDDSTVHTSLMASKGGLNGQYGCKAMKPLRAEIGVIGHGATFEWVDMGETLLENKNSIDIFTEGLYTVAYSRLHLLCFSLGLTINCGIVPLYHDTDSVYFTNNSNKVNKYVERFNNNITSRSKSSECYNFGTMDDDGHYKDFVTWGSKCYAATYIDYKNEIQVKATVAGATKKNLSKLFTEIVHDEGFDYLIDEYFHPNISYNTTINKKLIRKTPGTLIKGEFTDENGVKGILNEFSVTVLENCGYTLRALNTVNSSYYSFCYSLRGESFPFYIPEMVSIYNDNFSTYMKFFSEEQFESYVEGNPNSVFQFQHKMMLNKQV